MKFNFLVILILDLKNYMDGTYKPNYVSFVFEDSLSRLYYFNLFIGGVYHSTP